MGLPQRNRPINQVEIEHEIIRLIELLETETEKFAALAKDAAEKEANAKKVWAQAYISGEGSIKSREAWADYQTAAAQFDFKIAEGLVKAKREKLLSIRTSLDALRTLNANVRVMVS